MSTVCAEPTAATNSAIPFTPKAKKVHAGCLRQETIDGAVDKEYGPFMDKYGIK
jgi:hypothetical protein